MTREYGLASIQHEPGAVVTVGTFDGVHRGHQAIMRYLMRRAHARLGHSVVVSFDPHPRAVLTGERVPLLTTVEERAAAFERLGIDRFIVLPFDKSFASVSAEAFVEEILVARIGMKEIVIGYDHAFGRGRKGNRALLEAMGPALGFATDVIPQQVIDEHVVSSTEIRDQLQKEGNVALAATLLGRCYRLTGRVVEGDRRGRSIGYPTANLAVMPDTKVIPANGVYAVSVVRLSEGSEHSGMLNIGVRPTFDGIERRIEVHLFDFEGDLYGEQLRVEFVERIRSERKFASVHALTEQLSQDEARSRASLTGNT